MLNSSFESNNVYTGSYLYSGSVTAVPWLFTGGSGISGNYSAWGGVTSNGDYFAFLQTTSSVRQSFSNNGIYSLDISFDMVERPGYSPYQIVEVWFDDILQASIDPGDAWSTYSLNNLAVSSGNHTLEFRGISAYEVVGDATAFLDNIQMTSTPVPEPAAMSLIAIDLIPWFSRRRNA